MSSFFIAITSHALPHSFSFCFLFIYSFKTIIHKFLIKRGVLIGHDLALFFMMPLRNYFIFMSKLNFLWNGTKNEINTQLVLILCYNKVIPWKSCGGYFKFLTTCLHTNAMSKHIQQEQQARSHSEDFSQSFLMVMDFAMNFSLLECETLINFLFDFFLCHG